MSRVYFHSPSGDAELLGRERAHTGVLVNDIAEDRIKNRSHVYREPLRELTRESHLQPDKPHFVSDFITSFRVRGERLLAWRGHEIDTFAMALNTSIELGGEEMRLVARVEGQCEIHGYVEGQNRAWLADLIEQGLSVCVLRSGMGWDAPPVHPHGKGTGVVPLLRSRDDEPVVMSYSVEESFPYAARVSMPPPSEDWKPHGWSEQEWADLGDEGRDEYRDEHKSEAFGSLSAQERWDRGMAWLRARSEKMMLELKPDGWSDFTFGHGLSLTDLEAPDWQERVERALGFEASAVPEEQGEDR